MTHPSREELRKQLTDPITCAQKHTYYSYDAAKRARKRRNRAAGYDYLRAYKCNLGEHWHLTTEVKYDRPA